MAIIGSNEDRALRDILRIRAFGVKKDIVYVQDYNERIEEGLRKAENFARELPNFALKGRQIRQMHRLAFQEIFPWAGKYRLETDWDRDLEGEPSIEYTHHFTPARKIWHEMDALEEDTLRRSMNPNPIKRIENLARFHHRFLEIRPFLDGNGQIARVLTDVQGDRLFGRHIWPGIERNDYEQALSMADKGDLKPLTDLFEERFENAISAGRLDEQQQLEHQSLEEIRKKLEEIKRKEREQGIGY